MFGIYNNIFGAFISALLLGKLAGACPNNQTKRCSGAFAACCDYWLLWSSAAMQVLRLQQRTTSHGSSVACSSCKRPGAFTVSRPSCRAL